MQQTDRKSNRLVVGSPSRPHKAAWLLMTEVAALNRKSFDQVTRNKTPVVSVRMTR